MIYLRLLIMKDLWAVGITLHTHGIMQVEIGTISMTKKSK
jgi:hypothetical protein